jgi:signal transduction histidine kinase
MNGILGQLLNFSRERQAQHRPVTIDKMVEEVLALYDERAQDNGVRIELDLPEDPPRAPGGELYDVLSNLVKNSLDAMGTGGGKLSIRADVAEEQVVFCVSDTGPGIPPENRDKIFQPFFSTKRCGKGTGLGLAVCRDAVDRMGGSIELRPADEGAVFRVCLPFS